MTQQNYTSKSFLNKTFKEGKTKIGICSIEKYRNSIRIRFVIPQSYFSTKSISTQRSKTITIGSYILQIWKIAIEKCLEITSDIVNNTFDLTLIKYDSKRKLIEIKSEISPENNINDIRYHWERYKQHKLKENQIYGDNRKKGVGIAQSTITGDWKNTDNYLSNLPDNLYLIENSQQLLTYLKTKYSDGSLKAFISYLSTALNLSINFGDYTKNNPYQSLKKQLIIKSSTQSTNDYYFSTSEIEIIINAFKENQFKEKQENQRYSHHYTNIIHFRFLTGLRISESIALTWNDIIYENNEPKLIILNKAFLKGNLQLHTKTYKNRYFPINNTLKEYILSLPHIQNNHNLIFPNSKLNYINAENLSRIWKVIVSNLVTLGEIQQYLPLKNERSTFANQMLDNGIDKDTLAEILGHSPQVLEDNYLKLKENRQKENAKKIILPDFL